MSSPRKMRSKAPEPMVSGVVVAEDAAAAGQGVFV
jgi:hypothetical protein